MRLLRQTGRLALPIVAALLWTSFAGAAETLHAALQCPDTGPHTGCLRIWVSESVQDPAGGGDDRYALDASRTVRVRGRLLRGAAQDYELSATQPGYMFGSAGDLGPIAYLGRSPRNRPIVLTDRGPFEILTPTLDANAAERIVVFDRRTKRVAARYLVPADEAVVQFKSPTDVVVWDGFRGMCITAPRKSAGMLAVRSTPCAEETVASIYDSGLRGDFDESYKIERDRYFDVLVSEAHPAMCSGFLRIARIRGSDLMAAKISGHVMCDD